MMAHWASVPSCLKDLFEELHAAAQSCRLPWCPPAGLQCPLPKHRPALRWQFVPSDLIINWGKGRSCCFLMGKCPNAVCVIKKIACTSLMINKEQQDVAVPCWGLPWLCSPARQRNPDRVEIGPVPSTYRRCHHGILAGRRVASDRAVAFWSGRQRDHGRRRYS